MVTGFQSFQEWFRGFENQYIIIGGTACELLMEEEDLSFRATKDIDLVLIIEAMTPEFVKKFWEYILKGEYEHKDKGTERSHFYRFTNPKSKEYPYMIELFSKKPENLLFHGDEVLTPIPVDEDISSLSAILLNETYYELLKDGQVLIEGIPVLRAECLIPFKAKAWLDLSERKFRGERIDSKSIRKHKNDVFRLTSLLVPNRRLVLEEEIQKDMRAFLAAMEHENIDLKSLGIKGSSQEKRIDLLYDYFGLR